MHPDCEDRHSSRHSSRNSYFIGTNIDPSQSEQEAGSRWRQRGEERYPVKESHRGKGLSYDCLYCNRPGRAIGHPTEERDAILRPFVLCQRIIGDTIGFEKPNKHLHGPGDEDGSWGHACPEHEHDLADGWMRAWEEHYRVVALEQPEKDCCLYIFADETAFSDYRTRNRVKRRKRKLQT